MAALGAVLRVGDLLHPIDGRAVELLLDRDVAHGRRGRGPVPMLLARLKPHDVSRPYLFDRTPVALDPPGPAGHDQGLAERVGMPGGARTGLEGDERHADPGGLWRTVQWIDADRSGEPFGGSSAGRLRAVAFDFHDFALDSVRFLSVHTELALSTVFD
jgi:hypothetical protein